MSHTVRRWVPPARAHAARSCTRTACWAQPGSRDPTRLCPCGRRGRTSLLRGWGGAELFPLQPSSRPAAGWCQLSAPRAGSAVPSRSPVAAVCQKVAVALPACRPPRARARGRVQGRCVHPAQPSRVPVPPLCPRVPALSSLPVLPVLPAPPLPKRGGGAREGAAFDLRGGKKSVLFRLLANTTNSV